jgi:hypothetical protein
MFSRIREHFGTAGLIVAIVALVAALGGGAYAATGGPHSGKATASAKAKRGPRGPKGLKGDPGTAGQAGPAGVKGDAGAPGSNGTNGKDGTSVTSTESSTAIEGHCTGVGGSKFVSASGTTYACNGAKGKDGSPWTAGGTLPPGQTETGIWGAANLGPGGNYFPISFALPLAAAPTPVLVKSNEQSKPGCPGRGGGEFGAGKPGNVPTIPLAEPGKLCVYVLATESSTFPEPFHKFEYTEIFSEWEMVQGVSQTGTLLEVVCGPGCYATGTWAVTASED